MYVQAEIMSSLGRWHVLNTKEARQAAFYITEERSIRWDSVTNEDDNIPCSGETSMSRKRWIG